MMNIGVNRTVLLLSSGANVSRVICSHQSLYSQVVTAILRKRLLGQGDVVRLLAAKGYRLSHVQDPREEMSLAVTSLGVDLRSGLRLCRLIEILTGVSSCLSHFPVADSNLLAVAGRLV